MSMISLTYEVPIPNEFLVDHSQSDGKTQTMTYDGPDKIFLQIGEDGRETHGPVTVEDLADGRPIPADATLFEIDCTEYPLICQLRGPIVPHVQPTRDPESMPHPQSPVVEGYPQFKYSLPLFPEDIYNRYNIRVIDGQPTIQVFTAIQKLLDRDTPMTWDEIRDKRDKMLTNSDSQIAEDMPERVKEVWKAYRQKLRDLPTVLENAGAPPSIAYYMFPPTPDTVLIEDGGLMRPTE
jgi:hypothetical protein